MQLFFVAMYYVNMCRTHDLLDHSFKIVALVAFSLLIHVTVSHVRFTCITSISGTQLLLF